MEDITSIELFCRAANYLSVGMLYLNSNPLLREKLQKQHFKREVLGHWGACPGIIAVYAHTSDLIRRKNHRAHLVVGSGHANTALLACTYLDGSLGRYYSELSYGELGVLNLFKQHSTGSVFSTEINPRYPGTLYVGGELGYALAFSQGYSFGNKESFTVCVVGDGELETSVSQASWQGFEFLSSHSDGKILPVINANGNKMGSVSIFSQKSHKAIEEYFHSFGLAPFFANTSHTEIVRAFDAAYDCLFNSTYKVQPVIVLETPKGWTAPKTINGQKFEGSFHSHKPILKHPFENKEELEIILEWLLSYKPKDLFDADGIPKSSVIRCLPVENMRLGYGHKNEVGHLTQKIHNKTNKNLSNFFEDLLTKDNIFVFSPDELGSNRLNSLIDCFQLKFGDIINDSYNKNSRIYEILNENLCFAWAQGCSRAGKRSLLISYEAFAPIFMSMADQYIKYLTTSVDVDWQPICPSLNILLTSLGWYNTPSHHNPSFVDSILGRGNKIIRVYMPICLKSLSNYIIKALNSTNRLNVIVYNKHPLPLIEKNLDNIKWHNSWVEFILNNNMVSRVAIIAIGDCILEQVLEAKELLGSLSDGCVIDIFAIEDMSILESHNHPERQNIKRRLLNKPVIWAYNGFPKTIKSFLWDFNLRNTQVVLGFNGNDQTSSGKERFTKNAIDAKAIVNEVLKLAKMEEINHGHN